MPTGSNPIDPQAPSRNPRSPQLSLVVIVRDEADDLRRLLTHHRDLWDEAIVVDTGSRDDSVATARSCGATVRHFRWCDDFSAARNCALAAATGRMALVLDCDELIAPEDFSAVRALLDQPAKGWVFEQRNYCGAGNASHWTPVAADAPWVPPGAAGYQLALTCRLFPLGRDVVYEGLVHEVPDASLARAGVPLQHTGVAIHHRGHLLEPVRMEIKNVRYNKLLRRKVKQNPQDPKARFELAVQLVAEGRSDLARRLLARTIAEFPHHMETHPARLLLGRLQVAAGEVEAGLATVEGAVRKWPALREGWIEAARLFAGTGRHDEARIYQREGRRLFPTDEALQQLAGAAAAASAR